MRHIWITERGRLQRVEDWPDTCPGGHTVVQRPGWGACPGCGIMLRTWVCSQCLAVSVDDEHTCPPGARTPR